MNPDYPIVIKNLTKFFMVGTPVGNHAWIAFIWCATITIISLPLSGYLFRRHVS